MQNTHSSHSWYSQFTGISISNDCDFCTFLIKSISFQSVLISKSKDVCEYKVAANKITSREKTHQQRAAKIYFVKWPWESSQTSAGLVIMEMKSFLLMDIWFVCLISRCVCKAIQIATCKHVNPFLKSQWKWWWPNPVLFLHKNEQHSLVKVNMRLLANQVVDFKTYSLHQK